MPAVPPKQAAVQQYATVAEFCDVFRETVPAANSVDEAMLIAALRSATQAIIAYLGWNLAPVTESKIIWTEEQSYIVLPAPLRALTSAWLVNSQGERGSEWTSRIRPWPAEGVAFDGAHYVLHSGLETHHPQLFPAAPSGIEIVGDWGCSAMPNVVVHATCAAARSVWHVLMNDDAIETRADGSGMTVAHEPRHIPDASVIPYRYKLMLGPYRSPQR